MNKKKPKTRFLAYALLLQGILFGTFWSCDLKTLKVILFVMMSVLVLGGVFGILVKSALIPLIKGGVEGRASKSLLHLILAQCVFGFLSLMFFFEMVLQSQLNPRIPSLEIASMGGLVVENYLSLLLFPVCLYMFVGFAFHAFLKENLAIGLPTLLIANRKQPRGLFFYNGILTINTYANYACLIFGLTTAMFALYGGWGASLGLPAWSNTPFTSLLAIWFMLIISALSTHRLAKKILQHFKVPLGFICIGYVLAFGALFFVLHALLCALFSYFPQINIHINGIVSRMSPESLKMRMILSLSAWGLVWIPWASSYIGHLRKKLTQTEIITCCVGLQGLVGALLYLGGAPLWEGLYAGYQQPSIRMTIGWLGFVIVGFIFYQVYNLRDFLRGFMPKSPQWQPGHLSNIVIPACRFTWFYLGGLFLFGFVVTQVLLVAIAIYMVGLVLALWVKVAQSSPGSYKALRLSEEVP